jgi:hypothetical protein
MPRSSPMISTTAAKSITITVRQDYAYVSRYFETLERTSVHTEPKPYVRRGRSGWEPCERNLTKRVGPGMTVPSGAVPRVARELKARGFRVHIDDRRKEWRRPSVTCEECQESNYCSIEHAVTACHGGIFWCGLRRQRQEYLLEIVRALNPLKTLLVTPSIARRDQLYAQLKQQFDVGILHARTLELPQAVQVATIATAWQKCPDDFEAVVVPDGEHALTLSFALVRIPSVSRFFGLLGDRVVLNSNERLLLEVIFGDTILGTPLPRPFVAFQRVSIPLRCSADNVLDWKREAIWDNVTRNREVAEFAKAVAGATCLTTRPMPSNIARLVAEQTGDQRRVCLLVEGLDHARHLAGLLPDWPIIDLNLVQGPWMSLLSSLQPPGLHGRGCIVTYSAIDSSKVSFGNILIRADAGTGGLDPDCSAAPKVIIDLVDLGSSQLESRFRKRLAAYHAVGMEVDERARAQIPISPDPRTRCPTPQ